VNQTTNVTNISYNNTIIVNQGPNYDELRIRSQRPIQRLRLERQTTVATETRPVVRGEVVEMAAPVIASAQVVERPPTVKEKVTETVVEHGWERITDQPAAQRARAKMKSEAPPPSNAPSKTFVKPAPIAGQPRTGSPSPRATAPVVARSTIAPAPTVAVTRTVPPGLPKVGRPIPTATSTVAASPRATPARALRATATPVSTPMQTATPAATATPFPRLAPTATPHPTFAPRALSQQFSPAASPTPGFSTTPAPPGVGRADTKQERRAQKELRKQERAERKQGRFETTTATPVATATVSAAASPSVAATEPPGRGHKKNKRPGEVATSPTASP
jgi:hypothetical protein